MKRILNGDIENTVSLECTPKEVGNLWYAVEQTLKNIEADGLQHMPVYARLKAIEDVLSGKVSE